MGWLDDVKGLGISGAGAGYPDRKFLRFIGDGVSVSDNPAEDTTSIRVLPGFHGVQADSVFGRVGDVVAQPGDFNGVQVAVNPVGQSFSAVNLQSAIEEQIGTGAQGLARNFAITPPTVVSADYTISTDDWGTIIYTSGPDDIELTLVPDAGYPVGAVIPVVNGGTGLVSFSTSATLGVPVGKEAVLHPGRRCELRKLASSDWVLDGDLLEPEHYWQGQISVGFTDAFEHFTLTETSKGSSPGTPGWSTATFNSGTTVSPNRAGLYRIVARFHIYGSSYDNDVQWQSVELHASNFGGAVAYFGTTLSTVGSSLVSVEWLHYASDPSAAFGLVWRGDNGIDGTNILASFPSTLSIYRLGSGNA